MKTKAVKIDNATLFAAQNARHGLITAADLSILTGVEVGRLNKFAKTGVMNHYGEYHGKRFFNFEEIINWVNEPDDSNEAKPLIRTTLQATLRNKNCPFSLETRDNENVGNRRLHVVWKDFIDEAA